MKRIILTTDSVNAYGYRVISKGADLSLYDVNPVMLYMHIRGLIIGKMSDIKVEKDKITGMPEFAETDKGKECKYLYENGMLNMASIWVHPIEVSDDPKLKLEGQTLATITKWLLKETSLVDVGGNLDAIKLVDEHNNELKLTDVFKKPELDQTQNKKMNKELLELLKLSAEADESAMMTAVKTVLSERDTALGKITALEGEVTTLKTEKKGLEDKLSADEKAGFQKLLDDPKRKLTDDQKKTFLKLYDADAKSATEAVKALPTYKNLSDDNSDEVNEERKAWTFEEYTKKDSKALAAMKLSDPDKYKVLFKKQYGVEPKL